MNSAATSATRDPEHSGAIAGLAAAALFGAGTPIAKLLLGQVGPWPLAGILYTASGLALFCWRLVRRAPRVTLPRQQILPFAGAVLFGGMLGPVFLMLGLNAMPASGASLLGQPFAVAAAW